MRQARLDAKQTGCVTLAGEFLNAQLRIDNQARGSFPKLIPSCTRSSPTFSSRLDAYVHVDVKVTKLLLCVGGIVERHTQSRDRIPQNRNGNKDLVMKGAKSGALTPAVPFQLDGPVFPSV